MKLYRKRDLKRCGIYLIRNKINNKVYIGKSINIYERIRQHINCLNKKSKNENIHLINAWHKYSRDNFEYEVLEDISLNDLELKIRELYWMNFYDSLNRKYGYNLRQDSETKCILSEETKKRMSEGTKLYYKNNPEAKVLISKNSSEFWKNNPDIKAEMAITLSRKKQQFKFHQYDLNGNFIKEWNTIKEIILENPNYKWQNIYSVCNGYKPTIYGYKWYKIKI